MIWNTMSQKPAEGQPARAGLVRGEPVVRAVLLAAIEELAAVGYEALRIEDVAFRAQVNKTTVYRRWPSKPDLVLAALRTFAVEETVRPDTGSLRGDLLAIARKMSATMASPRGRGILRMLEADSKPPEFALIAETLRAECECLPKSVIDNAIARGELRSTDARDLLIGALAGIVQYRLNVAREPVDEGFLHQIVDLLLDGVSQRAPAR
jgi:AcrR family transcriptional regulator